MTLHRDVMGSPNYSSRSGTRVTHIVVHTAQGALTYESLGNYFASPSSGVSSHVGIDDTPNVVGEYVRRDWKAWTASNANPWSVQAELCGFAEWDADEWFRHPTMLANTAAWIAEEAAAFGLPVADIAWTAQDAGAQGVCQHNDLGAMGGGHWDCGPGFPVDHVLDLARTGGDRPVPEPKDPDMAATPNMFVATVKGGGQVLVIVDKGHVHPIATPDDVNAYTAAGVPQLGPLTSAEFNALQVGIGQAQAVDVKD